MHPLLQDALNSPSLARLRRNHALEHATIHLLSRRHPGLLLIGRSDRGGFTLYGRVETEALRATAEEALERLRRGEALLAVHPQCGTSLVTAGALAALAAFAALGGRRRGSWRHQVDRLPLAMLASTLALAVAQPLGLALQRSLTTMPDPGGLRIGSITRLDPSIHRVETHG